VLGLVVLGLWRLRSSRFGRALLLVGTDRRAAASVGVSPWRYKTFAFVIAGVLAGVAGALVAPHLGTPPSKEAPGLVTYTAFHSLFYLAIPVLAGFGSLLAVVVVAMALTLIPLALEPYRISPLILGGVGLGIGTLIGRAGLAGVVADQRRAWRRRRGTSERQAAGPVRYQDRRRALEVLEAYLPSPSEAEVALSVRGISVAFDGLQVLAALSITVPARRQVGLIGPNGAGKSTLFDVVNGLLRPDRGTVHLFGRDVTRLPAWDRAALGMGRTFQAQRINLHQSVRDNLLAGAYTTAGGSLPGVLLGLPGAGAGMRRAEDAAWAVATLFGIDRYWDERPVALSFGNRRRVEIGRSLLAGPRLLLLDEPTAGLDPTASAILLSLLNELQANLGLTVLLVEHNVRAVLEHCDLVYVLAQGELVAAGSPAEIMSHPEVRSQYLGADFLFRAGGGGTS
ncbi:MAG TPA: ATP-binding cassette domain-containing protein, partial [Acidimicrobiia bacterium]